MLTAETKKTTLRFTQNDANFPLASPTALEAGLAHPQHFHLSYPGTYTHLPSRHEGPLRPCVLLTQPQPLTGKKPLTLSGKKHLVQFFMTFSHIPVK